MDALTDHTVDPVTGEELIRLSEQASGPCASLFLPTHRAGPETAQDPIRLGNLVADAERSLVEHGLRTPDAQELLAPARALIDDDSFWPYQSDGLAVHCAAGVGVHHRVPFALREEATVARSFRIRPLLPAVVGDGHFFLLALSQNQVRLFEATRGSIGQRSLGSVPASMAEALAHEDPERQLQFRSGGAGGEAQFHGHGAGDEIDKEAIERFLRAVDRGLPADVGSHPDRPLVLAAVGYYGPLFAAVSSRAHVLDDLVEGNPDHASPDELHAAAWGLVEPRIAAEAEADAARLAEALGTGLGASGVVEVTWAAVDGRIDTLFVDDTEPVWGRIGDDGRTPVLLDGPSPDVEDLLDRAVLATLAAGGRIVRSSTVTMPDDAVVAARLRY